MVDWMKKTALRLRTMLHHVHTALRKAPTAPSVMALGLGESKIEEEVLAVKEDSVHGEEVQVHEQASVR